MAVLESHVERGEEHERRRARVEQLVAELRERTALVTLGGGEKAVERHRSRGKLTARERIERAPDLPGLMKAMGAMQSEGLFRGLGPFDPAGRRSATRLARTGRSPERGTRNLAKP